MNFGKTLFAQLMDFLPWKTFHRIVARHDGDRYVKSLIVRHFTGRSFQGKAMVVSIDKATALRMYDKVRKVWPKMDDTDMAVVVSPGQNEIEQMKKLGLDIVPHRKRMNEQALDEKFKDPEVRRPLSAALTEAAQDV